MPPKDFIIYIDKDTDKTVACLAWTDTEYLEELVVAAGHRVIGKVSAGSETEACDYGNTVLRR
jgi:hypothetical protein